MFYGLSNTEQRDQILTETESETFFQDQISKLETEPFFETKFSETKSFGFGKFGPKLTLFFLDQNLQKESQKNCKSIKTKLSISAL